MPRSNLISVFNENALLNQIIIRPIMYSYYSHKRNINFKNFKLLCIYLILIIKNLLILRNNNKIVIF